MTAPDAASLVEIAPTGSLRAAINTANAATTTLLPDGTLSGPSVELAQLLAQWLGVSIELIPHGSAGEIVAAVGKDVWDIAFLAVDPKRAATFHFSPPYLQIEATYAVHRDSPIQSVEDVDRSDVRIASSAGAAYDLQLERCLREATRQPFSNPKESYQAFRDGGFDAVAGIRQSLQATLSGPSFRILTESFHTIDHAIALDASRTRAAKLVDTFMSSRDHHASMLAAP